MGRAPCLDTGQNLCQAGRTGLRSAPRLLFPSRTPRASRPLRPACPPWLPPTPAADYALSKPDVYAVSIRQLLGWMKSPTATDETTPESLGCGLAGGAPGTGVAAKPAGKTEEAPAEEAPAQAEEEEASSEEESSSSDAEESSGDVEERSAQPFGSLADALAAAGYKV